MIVLAAGREAIVAGALPELAIPAMVAQPSRHLEADMRFFPIMAIYLSVPLCAGVASSAHAQSGGGRLDFGVLESGVLPGGAELPDLTGDTVDPDVEARQPKRAQALPPPEDLYDVSPKPPVKKRR